MKLSNKLNTLHEQEERSASSFNSSSMVNSRNSVTSKLETLLPSTIINNSRKSKSSKSKLKANAKSPKSSIKSVKSASAKLRKNDSIDQMQPSQTLLTRNASVTSNQNKQKELKEMKEMKESPKSAALKPATVIKSTKTKRTASENKFLLTERSPSAMSTEYDQDDINRPAIIIDYEQLVPTQCTDLTKLNYTNKFEKYLITRLYSNVSKLSSYLMDMPLSYLKSHLNTCDTNECLPLYYAIKADNLNSVKLLIKLGSTLSRTTSHGDPAVHLACLLGCSIELVDYLLTFNSQKYLYLSDQEGWTIFHCACNEGHLHLVKYLIKEKHINPNVKDFKNKYTGLQLAAINNRLNVVEYLLGYPTEKSNRCRPFTATAIETEKETATDGLVEFMKSKDNDKFLLSSFNNNKTSNSKSNLVLPVIKLNEEFRQSILLKSDQSNSNLLSFTNNTKKRIHLESANVYKADTRFYTHPVSVYKNQLLIDLHSQNSDGQNVLHLACRYGLYDIVNILLKKYASHELDVNTVDYKGKTCLDLAWNWLLGLDLNSKKSNSNSDTEEDNNSRKLNVFYDSENAFYIQRNMLIINRKIDNEFKLIHLLYQYGAKFSSYKLLLYDLSFLKQSEVISEDEYLQNAANAINNNKRVPVIPFQLPTTDHISFRNLKAQNSQLLSIMIYLKSIIFLLKLNLPSMFIDNAFPISKQSKQGLKTATVVPVELVAPVSAELKTTTEKPITAEKAIKNNNISYYFILPSSKINFETNNSDISLSSSLLSSPSSSTNIINSVLPTEEKKDKIVTGQPILNNYNENNNVVATEATALANLQTEMLKKEFAYSLHDLINFIQIEVVDLFEKQVYYEYIQMAFEYLSRF